MTMLALTLKATVTLLFALGIAGAAKQARASMRHLVVAASFAFLLLLPVATLLMPSVLVPVSTKADWARAVVPAITAASVAANGPVLVPAPREELDVALLLVALYAAGVVFGGVWLVRGLILLREIARRGTVWLEGMNRMNELAKASDIRRAVLVMVSNEVSVPMTFGFRRQTIVMPAASMQWSAETLRRALRHELEHVRRADWALQLLARVACIFYWPHPLVWVAWRRLQLDAEIAADDAVLTSRGETATDEMAYADQLLTLARSLGRRRPLPAVAMASHSSLSSRIESILAARAARGPIGRVAATMTIACAMAVLVALAPVRVVAAAFDDPESLIEAIRNDDHGVGEALIKAAERGRIDEVAQLLDAGLDVNTNLTGDGSALLVAARFGHLELITYLLGRGADVNLPSRGDGNPLIVAAQTGREDVARMLLDHGALIDEVVPGDENPLIAASEAGHLEVVRLLLARGANASTRVWADNREWRSPLIMARRGGHDAIVRELLGAGAQ